jgi:hypothetical protein
LIHLDLAILAPLAVALRLLSAEFLGLLGGPVFLISQPTLPNSGSLGALGRAISAQVMIGLKTPLAPFQEA